jgi:hypothetical protein
LTGRVGRSFAGCGAVPAPPSNYDLPLARGSRVRPGTLPHAALLSPAQERANLLLSVRGLVRLSIQEPLALGASEQRSGAFVVGDVAMVGAEIELSQIAVQVRFAD